jgi:hypothetical protein
LGNFRRGRKQFPIKIIWVAAEFLKAEHIKRRELVERVNENRKFRPARSVNVPRNNANVIS